MAHDSLLHTKESMKLKGALKCFEDGTPEEDDNEDWYDPVDKPWAKWWGMSQRIFTYLLPIFLLVHNLYLITNNDFDSFIHASFIIMLSLLQYSNSLALSLIHFLPSVADSLFLKYSNLALLIRSSWYYQYLIDFKVVWCNSVACSLPMTRSVTLVPTFCLSLVLTGYK